MPFRKERIVSLFWIKAIAKGLLYSDKKVDLAGEDKTLI